MGSRVCNTNAEKSHRYPSETPKTLDDWSKVLTRGRRRVLQTERRRHPLRQDKIPATSGKPPVHCPHDTSRDSDTRQPPGTKSIKSLTPAYASSIPNTQIFRINVAGWDKAKEAPKSRSRDIRRRFLRRRGIEIAERGIQDSRRAACGIEYTTPGYSNTLDHRGGVHSGLRRGQGRSMVTTVPSRNQVSISTPTLATDSEGAYNLSKTTKFLRRSRHLEHRFHYLRQ